MNRFIAFLFFLLLSVQTVFSEEILDYNFENTDCVKIPLRITEPVTTASKNKAYEGQRLEFKVVRSVYYNNRLLVKKGATATARLGQLTTRGFAGVPAEIFITDFRIPNLDSNKIMQPISKRGFSMTEFILPIKWALTPFPPTGSITNIIVGFNAKITPRDVLYVDYYPTISY